MFILNNLCAPYTWQILTAASELSSLYLSFCSPLMIFRIIISKYPQYIVVWATHLLCGNLEVGLMQNPWIRSAGKVSGESTFPSIFIWCKMKAAIYRQSCSKQKLTGSPGFVTLREIENILGFLNKHSVVCDWLWSNCSMEENIMHSMSQQHFPPGTDDSKVPKLSAELLSLDENLDCIHQYLLVPPLEVDLYLSDWHVEPSKVHLRLEDTTQCAAKALGSWCRRRNRNQSQKFIVPVHVPVVGSFKMRSLTELATGGCCPLQMVGLIWGRSVDKTVSVKLYISCKIQIYSHKIKGYLEQIWKLLIHVCTFHSGVGKSTTKIPALLG